MSLSINTTTERGTRSSRTRCSRTCSSMARQGKFGNRTPTTSSRQRNVLGETPHGHPPDQRHMRVLWLGLLRVRHMVGRPLPLVGDDRRSRRYRRDDLRRASTVLRSIVRPGGRLTPRLVRVRLQRTRQDYGTNRDSVDSSRVVCLLQRRDSVRCKSSDQEGLIISSWGGRESSSLISFLASLQKGAPERGRDGYKLSCLSSPALRIGSVRR